MVNSVQRSAMIAIGEGHHVRKVTVEALKRKGFATDGPGGRPALTPKGQRFVNTGEILIHR